MKHTSIKQSGSLIATSLTLLCLCSSADAAITLDFIYNTGVNTTTVYWSGELGNNIGQATDMGNMDYHFLNYGNLIAANGACVRYGSGGMDLRVPWGWY